MKTNKTKKEKIREGLRPKADRYIDQNPRLPSFFCFGILLTQFDLDTYVFFFQNPNFPESYIA